MDQGFKLFYQPNTFDKNYLLKVPPDILSKYFNNLMALWMFHFKILFGFKFQQSIVIITLRKL